VHTTAWPDVSTLGVAEPRWANVMELAVEVLQKIRTAKTEGKRNLRWPVTKLEVLGSETDGEALKTVLADVLVAGAVAPEGVTIGVGQPPERARFAVKAILGEQEPAAGAV
jgi:hypothetical protein